MQNPSNIESIEKRIEVLKKRWESYVKDGNLALFIEFTVSINSLTERCNAMRMPGLVRLCETLEMSALEKLSDSFTHPLSEADLRALQSQLDDILASFKDLYQPFIGQRKNADTDIDSTWLKPRAILVVAAPEKAAIAESLCRQLAFFRFSTVQKDWNEALDDKNNPLAVLFIPSGSTTSQAEFSSISMIRKNNPTTQLIYLGKQTDIEVIVALLRSGIDVTIPYQEQPSLVMSYVLDLVQTVEQDKSRVLIVEDSKVAVAVIERTLTEHGIDTFAIHDPSIHHQSKNRALP